VILRFLYLIAAYLAVPVISLIYLWRGIWERSYWEHFGQRFGFGAPVPPHGVWLHAVSVGEVQACAALVNALHRRHPALPLTVTSFTPTGAARARALFGDIAQVRYLPYDLPGAVRRFLGRVQPALAVIFETELWPNLYRECGRRRVPLVIASARISSRSVGRYQRLGSLFSATLARASVVAAQGPEDAERFRALGADPAALQVDFELPADIVESGAAVRTRYAPQRPMWVAGSTHAGEEQALIAAQRAVLQVHPDALLVIAPRHPPRFAEVAQLLAASGLRCARRSQPDELAAADCQVLLLDTLGELVVFYAAADVAFVGGSLVNIGGHNLLEPAALGVPVLTGPHNFNSIDSARLLIGAGAAQVVNDASELGGRVSELLGDARERARLGALARDCVAANRGALGKLLGLIEPLLSGGR
jgi:3-deoxy-D-manno-octulosonic-acid transferase